MCQKAVFKFNMKFTTMFRQNGNRVIVLNHLNLKFKCKYKKRL